MLSGEYSNPFSISFGEVFSKVVPVVLQNWSGAPFVEGLGEDTRVFKVDNGGANGRCITDGIMGLCKSLTVANLAPEVFEWLCWVLLAFEIFLVGGEVVGCHGSVG